MNCPDCKGSIDLKKVNKMTDITGNADFLQLDEIYYKCPKCKKEFEAEDLEE